MRDAELGRDRRAARIGADDADAFARHLDMAQDQRQHALADAAEAEHHQAAAKRVHGMVIASRYCLQAAWADVRAGASGRRVVNLGDAGAVEAVEAGAQARAIGAELADFDPVALADVVGQQERSAHRVGAVAGRAEEAETGAASSDGAPSGRMQRTG